MDTYLEDVEVYVIMGKKNGNMLGPFTFISEWGVQCSHIVQLGLMNEKS